MKAIDIIRAMIKDPSLAEHSNLDTMHEDWKPEDFIKTFFGEDFFVLCGHLIPGEWLSVWSADADAISPFQMNNTPDVVLEREGPFINEDGKETYPANDRQIYLWKVED